MAVNKGDRKVYAFGEDAQEKIASGIKKGADAVATTLGVGASNVLIERKHQTPIVVDDGYTLINNLILDDDLENLAIASLVDAANKASKHAGDGTSTTIVLTRAIYEAGRKFAGASLTGSKSPYQIKKEIMEAKDLIIAELNKNAKKIETQEDIRKVAYAAYSDDAIADVVAEMVFKVGENGIVIVEEGWGRETETELITGMRFAGKLAHNFLSNTIEEGLSLDNASVLVTDFDFVNLNDATALIQDAVKDNQENLVIVANKFERTAIDQVIYTNRVNAQNRSPFRIWLLRTPSFTPSDFEDMAIYLGARYISKEQGDKIIDASLGDLGRASSLKLSKNGDGVILGGAGTKEAVDARIEDLKKKYEDQKVEMVKNRIGQQIASLASAIGIIKVASPSDGETEHIRLKTKNAVKSAQAAIAEGVIEGGGMALKQIAESLSDNILTDAIKVPYEVIKRNAGVELNTSNIYDAVKIIRTALEQACSQAWLLINTKTAIAFRTERDEYDGLEKTAEAISGIKVPGRKEY